MLELHAEQKTIYKLFSELENYFLIPDYQRPYSWRIDECETLWEDIQNFIFPNGVLKNFDSAEDVYFLGTIVTFKNSNKETEVIDGQQRLTTLMLLLRAFYSKYKNMIKVIQGDPAVDNTYISLSKCIWKSDVFGNIDKNSLKINLDSTDDYNKNELTTILKEGKIPATNISNYANNYKFFVNKINEFANKFANFFSHLPIRILHNCVLLPISTKNQEDALQIFSTLNDRGKPLSDSDIFKSQLYKYFLSINQKKPFLEDWENLTKICKKIFDKTRNDPTDEIFIRYMHCVRAKNNIKTNSVEGLRKFYEKWGNVKYELLKNKATFEDLKALVNFWNDIYDQNSERFSNDVLKQLFILNFAPNNMWTFIVSVYFMSNKNDKELLDNNKFELFLKKIVAFVLATEFVYPGVSNLKTPLFNEMVEIKKHKEITFKDYLFSEDDIRSSMEKFNASNNKKMTKAILSWWVYNSNSNQEIQELLNTSEFYDIEHIFPKSKLKFDILKNPENVDSLGNKSLLERSINSVAANFNFQSKRLCYLGKIKPNKATKIVDLLNMANDPKFANLTDFTDNEINERTELIINNFVKHLKDLNLIKIN